MLLLPVGQRGRRGGHGRLARRYVEILCCKQEKLVKPASEPCIYICCGSNYYKPKIEFKNLELITAFDFEIYIKINTLDAYVAQSRNLSEHY